MICCYPGENNLSKNDIVRREEHFDAGFLVPLLASLSNTESSSHADDELEGFAIHISSACNCDGVEVADYLFHNQQRSSVPYNSVSNLDNFGIPVNP